MNKITSKILLTLFSLIAFLCTQTASATTIKIATLSPDGTFWMKQMRAGADEINEKTQGRVTFKFYPGGVMGNDENVLRKIRIGQLHGGAVTIGNLSQTTPDVTIYGFPLLFSSLDEAANIRKNTDAMLSKQIEDDGFVNFGFAQGGFSYLMSKQPIRRADDLKKLKSWVPEGNDIGLSVFQYIGATPIALPMSDVLTGLQTDLIDTVITSPIAALALQWHSNINYVTDEPINYLMAMMIIDKKVFDTISASDQLVVRDVMSKVYKTIDKQNMVDNIAAREALINQGVKFINLDDGEKEKWVDIRRAVIAEMKQKYQFHKDFYNAVLVSMPDSLKMH